MIRFYNDLSYNKFRVNHLGGNVTGIWENDSLFVGSNSYPIMNYHYVTSQFNHFEKNIFSNDFKINYHLSGYGIKFNESLKSFLGESSERYAFTLLYQNIKSDVIEATYRELVDNRANERIIPLEYINVYFTRGAS